jgi:phenylacetate-CoA ligase
MRQTDRNSGILCPEEKFDSGDRLAYQERFLAKVVDHAYSEGTPLKSAMQGLGLQPGDIARVEDLEKLPITKKKDLSEAQRLNPPFGGFLTTPVSELVRIHQSPGPIYDPVGKVPDYWRWKTALYSIGFRPGDLVVNTFAYHLTPAGHMFEEGVCELGATIIPTGVGNTETQVDVITHLGVTGYIGTPSFLAAIIKKAEEIKPDAKDKLKLEVAFLAAEMLPESLRKKFHDDYGIIGRQAYGTADVGCIAYECPSTNGMHVHHDVIVEIIDPATGKPAAPGDPGEIVVTCNNMVYPLVRFGTGDLSSMVYDRCSCGRTSPRLTRILGRVDEVTKVKGMFVHPSQVKKVLEAFPEITGGRLLVERTEDQDRMTLEIKIEGKAEEGLVDKVKLSLREVLKLKGDVRLLPADAQPHFPKIIEDLRKWD